MTLNFNHVAQVYTKLDMERRLLAEEPLAALRAIAECSPDNRDEAGIAYRGQLVYLEILDGRYSADQLAAARYFLMLKRASMSVIEAIESARIREVE